MTKYEGFICEICLKCAAKYRAQEKYYCEVCAIMKGIFNDNPNLFKDTIRRDRRHKYFMDKQIIKESTNGRLKW